MSYGLDTTNPDALTGLRLTGSSGAVYTLGKKIKQGGEGITYEAVGAPNKIIKLYRSDKLSTADFREREAKISVMLCNPPAAQSNRPFVAWPTDLLRNNGIFVGFVMPRADSVGNLKSATRPDEIPKHYPNYTWRYGVIIARNLATAVGLVHNCGAVVGDLNHNNILVDSHGYITLIDTDSFTINDRRTGAVYKTKVALPEIVAPELQGLNWSDESSVFTRESDCFSLAVHIFGLLCNNGHPFSCIWTGNNSSVSSCDDRQVRNIITGRCAYVSNPNPHTRPQRNIPSMDMFPGYIRDLFDRAFSYNEANAKSSSVIKARPSAAEWLTALDKLLQEPTHTCTKYATHVYPAIYGKCPWCEIGLRPVSVAPNPAPNPAPAPKPAPKPQPSSRPAPTFTPYRTKTPVRPAPLRSTKWLSIPAVVFGACGGSGDGVISSAAFQLIFIIIGALIGLGAARIFKNKFLKAKTTFRAFGWVAAACLAAVTVAAGIVALFTLV